MKRTCPGLFFCILILLFFFSFYRSFFSIYRRLFPRFDGRQQLRVPGGLGLPHSLPVPGGNRGLQEQEAELRPGTFPSGHHRDVCTTTTCSSIESYLKGAGRREKRSGSSSSSLIRAIHLSVSSEQDWSKENAATEISQTLSSC